MARLTEQEQQEIIRFVEADKPLPDRYRFLLFADKREVVLGSVAHECLPDRRKIAVKLAGIFGNDTMTIIEVRV